MKTNLVRSSLIALSVLLLIAAGNGAERKKDEKNRGVIRIVGQPSQGDMRKALSVQKPSVSEERQAGPKFDMRRFGREVRTLKKISEERVIMERMQQSHMKAEREHAARKAVGVQHLDKVKIFGKPTRFNQASGVPKPTLSNRAARSLASNVLINGKTQDTISVGDPFALTFSFAPNYVSAMINVYFDADSNGVVSAGDILLEGNILVLDDDENDDDPASGTCKLKFGDGDGLNRIAASFLFEVNDYASISSAMLTVRQKPTSSIVFGTVDPPRPYIACYVSGSPSGYDVFTDSAGKFSFYVDRQSTTQLSLRPFDFTGVTSGYIPPQSKVVSITSDTTRVDFTFTAATSFIEGYVKDQTGDAVRNIMIAVYGPNFYVYVKTDTLGYYKAGVAPGQWYLYPIYPQTGEYMRKNSSSINVNVSGNETVRNDIFLLKANNTISGKVTFNANGVGGIGIYADTDTLYNSVLSSTNGGYSIPVYKPSTGTKLYYVNAGLYTERYFVVDPYRSGIQPGATDVNFEIKKVAGGLEGRITNINTGKSIPDAYISISGPNYKSTTSNDSGFYHMSLQDGTYSISVNANSYYYYTESNIVIAGSIVTKNITLLRSGSFSGTVKDEAGNPLYNASFSAVDSAGYSAGYGYPDVSGNYVVSNLKTSKYRAYARAIGYVGQWYDKVSVMDSATFFQVTDGFDTPNINFVLSRGGSVSGKVVDKAGKPLPGIEIDVMDTMYSYRSYAITNDSGFYSVGGLETGKYYLRTYNNIYIDQWYDGVSDLYSATKVSVVINQNTPNINFTLFLGASISGTVKNKNNATILSANVTVLDSAFNSIAYGYTNDSGYFHISRLVPGKKFYVVANASGYALRWYNNVSSPDSATPIVLMQEESRENINFILPAAGKISGTVKNKAGVPIQFANVYVAQSNGYGWFYGNSDDLGNYIIGNVNSGKYIVSASQYDYTTQWYDHKYSVELADTVIVEEEKTVSNINFNLSSGGKITGTVKNTNGQPIPYAYVYAYGLNAYYGGCDDLGNYTITNISPGKYTVLALHEAYLGQWYDHKSSMELADSLVVEEDKTTSNINFDLKPIPPPSTDSIVVKLTLANIPDTLVFSKTGLPDYEVDYWWGIRMDVDNNINTGPFGCEMDLAIYHYKSPGDQEYKSDILGGTYHNLLELIGDNAYVRRYGVTVSRDPSIKNTLVIKAPKSWTELTNVTHSTRYYVHAFTQTIDMYGVDLTAASSAFVQVTDPSGDVTPNYYDYIDVLKVTPSIVTSVGDITQNAIPSSFSLNQNYPNPFNPSTTIAFDIPSQSFVSLRVYNILGQEVAALVDEVRPAGRYHERWNANTIASGIYFYAIRAGSFTETRKMVLIR
jgi:protocatechuate 3,4-dioxygenase beta subunit